MTRDELLKQIRQNQPALAPHKKESIEIVRCAGQ